MAKKKQAPAKLPDLEIVAEESTRPLTAKQQRFVDEFLKDLCATKAAIRAGYSKKTASEQGYQLLQKPSVIAAVNKAIKERRDRVKMEADEVLLEYARIARSNILDYLSFGPAGVALRESTELIEGEARAIAEVSETFSKSGQSQFKIRLHPKQNALDSLAKHLKLYEENPININLSWMDVVSSAKEAKEKARQQEIEAAAGDKDDK